ncbi:putative RNA-directed DNA polymerase, eukaryota, reverse transcriptase zinc-binding domain protein [Tanacetum coccineum]
MGDSEWKEVTRKKSQSVFTRLKFPSNKVSMVDDLSKISLTVYVSNFPSHLTVRELWNICGKAGTLVDVYIANRKNKFGQMFAFYRFIKVLNPESLIASLSNVWIGKLRLHANVARFQRIIKRVTPRPDFAKAIPQATNYVSNGSFCKPASSYVNVAKNSTSSGIKPANVNEEEKEGTDLMITLKQDKPCDFPVAILGCYKDFCSIANTRNMCRSEVSVNDVTYAFRVRELCSWTSSFINDDSESEEENSRGRFDLDKEKNLVDNDAKSVENLFADLEIWQLTIKIRKLKKMLKIVIIRSFGDLNKGRWVRDLCNIHKVKFLAIQETKMLQVDLWMLRQSRILCNENYVVIDGLWTLNGIQIRWIVVYAPQNLSCKIALWSSLANLIADRDDILMMMRDFNKVHEADGFNYTWMDNWGSKMSKLDRFLVSKSFYETFPHISRVILVKGIPTSEFDLHRGLRQGDPLYPFIFILAMEGLHSLSCKAEELGLFKGASFGRDNMIFSHLMHVDDVIFLGEWSETNTHNLICMLRYLFLIFKLKINVHKSNVLGVGLSDMEVSNMAKLIGCGVAKFPLKYLGVVAQLLSVGGRLTLLKAILGNLPTYYMSIYMMPYHVQNKLESIRNNFFIGVDQGEKKYNMEKMEEMHAEQEVGGPRD